MDKTIEAIESIIRTNYPHLLEGGVTVTDYYFIDCAKNTEIPVKNLDILQSYLLAKNIKDFTLVIYFSNNTIGYRLKI
jgi:hypothetical protein